MEKLERKLELRLYRWQNAVWLFFGWAAVVSCLTFMLDEQTRKETAVGAQLSLSYQYAWNVSWGVGGALIILGVGWWLQRTEVIGHVLFGGAILTNAIAIFVTVRAFIPTLSVLVGFTLASFFRAFYIFRFLPRRGEGAGAGEKLHTTIASEERKR